MNPHGRIARALVASAAPFAVSPELRAVDERPWASATFAGSRLTITLALAGGDPAAWLASLPEANLPIPGRLVADLVVRSASNTTATLEMLLLET